MESFAKLRRRTTDLFDSLPKNMPNMPNMPHMPHMPHMPSMKSSGPAMKGTWQHVDIPALPRSSHSVDVVGGSAYIFGGEVAPRQPVDNRMHIVTLPFSSAPADYYSVPAQPSPRIQLADTVPPPTNAAGEPEESAAAAQLREPLSDVPLVSPPATDTEDDPTPTESLASPVSASDKGKATAGSVRDVPAPRLGHATAVIGTRIFLFGGRGAPDAASTLDEGGCVWVFETKTHTWSQLKPASPTPGSAAPVPAPIPPPRSYCCAAATDKPREFHQKPARAKETWKAWAEGDSAEVGIPQRPVAGHVAETAQDEEETGYGTFVIHGGCLADGGRTNDVWAFDVHSRVWKQLPQAPGAARGGAALAIARSRLYRFGGFDGTAELGGQLDVLEVSNIWSSLLPL